MAVIRRTRPSSCPGRDDSDLLQAWRHRLTSRRRFLVEAAGGSVALLFGLPAVSATTAFDPWPTLDTLTQHLLPSEPDSPGAREINAIGYLRFVVADPKVDAETREFILQGNQWLEELAQQRHGQTFTLLDGESREQLLREIVATPAGENWIATLLTYLFEALLTAPAYGGNPDGIGWRWLAYIPGFPLPTAGTRYTELPL
jgi:gluconate 2-dehydrogenase gamma chain